MASPVLAVDASARRMTCPRCNRPGVVDGRRVGPHCLLRKAGDTRRRMPRCAGSDRWVENARLRISPLKMLGLRGIRMTAKERKTMMIDALTYSHIDLLEFTTASPAWRGMVEIRFKDGGRTYSWRCGVGGWILLWKCYRRAARTNEGRFSLGRAVNLWREMPSIKRAAAKRQQEELAEEPALDVGKLLKASLRTESVDPFELSLVDPITQETLGGEHDERTEG